MFYNCELLTSWPDISKWNINHVTNMIRMFEDCKSLSSLSSLPDISKWNTNNVTYINYMFYNDLNSYFLNNEKSDGISYIERK